MLQDTVTYLTILFGCARLSFCQGKQRWLLQRWKTVTKISAALSMLLNLCWWLKF